MFERRTCSVSSLLSWSQAARIHMPRRQADSAAVLSRVLYLVRHHFGVAPVPDVDRGLVVDGFGVPHRRPSRQSPFAPLPLRLGAGGSAYQSDKPRKLRRHLQTRRDAGMSPYAWPVREFRVGRSDRRPRRFRSLAEMGPGERQVGRVHRACRRIFDFSAARSRYPCATPGCCSSTLRNRALSARPYSESKSWMASPVFSLVDNSHGEKSSTMFLVLPSELGHVAECGIAPSGKLAESSVAPGTLSSAPPAPPPRPPRPPRRLRRHLVPRRATRGPRALRRIMAHRQPRTRWTKGEGLDAVDDGLLASS